MHLNNTAWEKERYPEWDLRCSLQSWWIRCLPAYKCRMHEYPNKGCIRISGPRMNGSGQIEEGLTAVSGVEGWRGHCFGSLRNKRQKVGQWGRVIKVGRMWSKSLKMSVFANFISQCYHVAPWVFIAVSAATGNKQFGSRKLLNAPKLP